MSVGGDGTADGRRQPGAKVICRIAQRDRDPRWPRIFDAVVWRRIGGSQRQREERGDKRTWRNFHAGVLPQLEFCRQIRQTYEILLKTEYQPVRFTAEEARTIKPATSAWQMGVEGSQMHGKGRRRGGCAICPAAKNVCKAHL